MSDPMVVAIDGPSGAGKSTAGRALARRLGWIFVDSGAMYRALALLCLRSSDPEAALAALDPSAAAGAIQPVWNGEGERTLLDGEDVTQAVRAPEVSSWASRISALPEVRRALVERQRQLNRGQGLVMDGRDIGTVVFPQARHKFFVVASLEERSRRRAKDEGQEVVGQVAAAIEERDRNDSTRATAPLKAAVDAVVIDTTKLAPEAVVARMLELMGHAARPAAGAAGRPPETTALAGEPGEE